MQVGATQSKGQAQRPEPSWRGNRLRWSPNESQFPRTLNLRPSRAFATGWSLLGLAATVTPFVHWWGETTPQSWALGTLGVSLPYSLAGLLVFAFGFSRFYAYRHFTLRQDEVECDTRRFLNRTHWKEPLKRYQGVLKQIRYGAGTRMGHSRSHYQLTLAHPNPRMNVTLHESDSWMGLNEAWLEYCRTLHLNGLEWVDGKPNPRLARDLERQIRLEQENPWGDLSCFGLPAQVKATTHQGTVTLEFNDGAACGPAVGVAVVCGALAGALYGWRPEQIPPVAVLGVICVAALARAAFLRWRPWRLTVAPNGVELSRRGLWGEVPVGQMAGETLENILIAPAGWMRRQSLLIVGGGETLVIGQSLGNAGREALQGTLISVLSQSPGTLVKSA